MVCIRPLLIKSFSFLLNKIPIAAKQKIATKIKTNLKIWFRIIFPALATLGHESPFSNQAQLTKNLEKGERFNGKGSYEYQMHLCFSGGLKVTKKLDKVEQKRKSLPKNKLTFQKESKFQNLHAALIFPRPFPPPPKKEKFFKSRNLKKIKNEISKFSFFSLLGLWVCDGFSWVCLS